ncbi:MAG: hypothetical protein IPI02_14950 [Sterolibacteriaceae bacterium]|nr:hypothetical protein [Sterolibacteriaceae bacterium]MBK7236852.1 hypothetical protein [Sterolibacteriaceae bacterium]
MRRLLTKRPRDCPASSAACASSAIKRAANTYRYYLTRAGRMAIAAFERLTNFAIVPAMAA